MLSSRAWLLAIFAVSTALTAVACGGSKGQTCAQGTEKCPCYGNSTCNPGLTCASSTCVNLGGAGGTTGSAGMGGTTGSGGPGGSSAGDAGGTSAAGTGGTSSPGTGGGAGTGGAAVGAARRTPAAAAADRAPTPRPIPRTAARAAMSAKMLRPSSPRTVLRTAVPSLDNAVQPSRPVSARPRSPIAPTTARASARPVSKEAAPSAQGPGSHGRPRLSAASSPTRQAPSEPTHARRTSPSTRVSPCTRAAVAPTPTDRRPTVTAPSAISQRARRSGSYRNWSTWSGSTLASGWMQTVIRRSIEGTLAPCVGRGWPSCRRWARCSFAGGQARSGTPHRRRSIRSRRK